MEYYFMTLEETRKFNLKDASEYMDGIFNKFKEEGEDMILSSSGGKFIRIKNLSDNYFINLINRLSSQTYDEQSYLSEYYSNEWIKLYTLILVNRRRNKIDKLKKNINGI